MIAKCTLTRLTRDVPGVGVYLSALLLLAVSLVAAGPAAAQDQRPQDAIADQLVVTDDRGQILESLPLPPQSGFCLHWFHSVTGGAVADCFRNQAGSFTLDSSYLHDYAAGLGDLPGRGRLQPLSTGGYLIEDMDEPLPDNRLFLRLAAPHVAQELRGDFGRVPLWPMAEHGDRVVLRLVAGSAPASATGPEPLDPDPAPRK